MHLGLDVDPLPDLQEVVEGDALVHLVRLHLPHADAGRLHHGPVGDGAGRVLLDVRVPREQLLHHISIFLQGDAAVAVRVIHVEEKSQLLFPAQLHLLLVHGDVDGLEVGHDGEEVLKVDLVGQATGPLAQVPVIEEGTDDFGSDRVELQVRDVVEVLLANGGT